MFSSNAKWEAKDSSDVLGLDELLLLRDLAYRALGQRKAGPCMCRSRPSNTNISLTRSHSP